MMMMCWMVGCHIGWQRRSYGEQPRLEAPEKDKGVPDNHLPFHAGDHDDDDYDDHDGI